MVKKNRKKMSIRMKRAIRWSLGTVLLLSALLIILIPGKEAEAGVGVTVGDSDSSIPLITDSDTIYTTGDGVFQFAYVTKQSGGDKVAVIVGYDYERSLSDGLLEIPDVVDAYVKNTHTQGTANGYVAVGKSGVPLYYETYTIQPVQIGVDENGDPVYENQKVFSSYQPCLYNNYDKWFYEDDGVTQRAADRFFYYDQSQDKYIATTDELHQRIMDATVAYLSNQHADKTDTGWKLSTVSGVGIFSKATNIKKLTTGKNLLGIGNYAFYECSSLEGITLGDGANTIGNYSFAKCINLKEANFPSNCSVRAIGDHAFYSCRALKTFQVPVAVKKIGDSAFEDCSAMEELDLCGNGQNVLLELMGANVFKDCKSLNNLIFPDYFKQELPLSYFSGCTSLNYVKIPNKEMKLTEDTVTFAQFSAALKPEFYFEGPDESEIHNIATTNEIAFKYMEKELYEKVFNASGSAGTGQIIYRVDNKNVLQYFYMDDTVKEVEIPGSIGPYKITEIGSSSFQANHTITKIIIPSSITAIGNNAFKGCHRLKDVIFHEPIGLQSIGDGAFDTQVIDTTLDSCVLDTVPVLTFTGTVSKGSIPFDYAMNKANNINRGSQPLTYITFYSGWPSNMTLKYNSDKDRTELTNYPRFTDLMSYTSTQYPYIDSDMAAAANAAYVKYMNGSPLTEDESNIVNAALNIEIPDGVESIAEGIFSGKSVTGNSISSINTNTDVLTVKTANVKEIEPYTFAGCSNLLGVYVNGSTSAIGDYAFTDCDKLIDVDITPSLVSLGKLPFYECDTLEEVDFGGSNRFTSNDGIIFGLNNGAKAYLLECLKCRGTFFRTGAITADELSEVTAIAEEAFKNCDGILSADFSKSKIDAIPNGCFEDTAEFYSITLPDTCKKIGKDAFKNSNIRYLDIPNSVNIIDPTAFEGDTQTITFYCQLDSMAANYAADYPNIVVQEKKVTYKVEFYDEDATTLLDSVYVNAGEDAITTVVPTKEGYKFKNWMPAVTNVRDNLKTYAIYETDEKAYTVTFIGYDDKVLYTQTVKEGEDAIEPKGPERSGYTFTGWRPAITKITTDVITYAQYEKNTKPSSSGSSSGSKSSGSGSDSNAKLYTLTVVDGSGGGSYAEGATVTIKANTPATDKTFDKWTCENSAITFASATTATTTFKMPASALTVTATFKTSASTQSSSGGVTSNNANNSTTTQTTTKPTTSTTVDVNKSGISNTGAASATVSGSTDNYIVKISDSSAAKKEVEEALKEKYGSIDAMKYFAMDITLYDSTGTKKITDTEGISVTITLPIPDDLIDYAGNNKVAYVVNGKLIDLNPKFTTINNVPCVTFTATHFSPYTVYVDTSNLTAGTVMDSTPKTGDGISPKWFLAIGLICCSIVLFTIRDKKAVKKSIA